MPFAANDDVTSLSISSAPVRQCSKDPQCGIRTRQEGQMKFAATALQIVPRLWATIDPHVVMAIVMPNGTLLALL
jgi:hypothetical protein